MFYIVSLPFLHLAALIVETRNKALVRLKLRPKALAKVKIVPDKHFRFCCSFLKLADLWLLSTLSKKWTGQYALKIFENTRRMGYLKRDREYLRQQNTEEFSFRGTKLFVCNYGSKEGKPILLIHGWDANGLMLRPIAEHLAKHKYQVIVPDLPGHGASGFDSASVYDMSEAVARLTKRKGSLHAVIGHSTGGIVGALAIASGLKCQHFVSLGIPSSLGKLLDINVALHTMPRCTRQAMEQLYTINYGKTPEEVGLQMLVDWPNGILICHDKYDVRVPLEGQQELYAAFPKDQIYICNTGSHNGILKAKDVHARIAVFLEESDQAA